MKSVGSVDYVSIGRTINALTDRERCELLHWLTGYAPEAVQRGLDRHSTDSSTFGGAA